VAAANGGGGGADAGVGGRGIVSSAPKLVKEDGCVGATSRQECHEVVEAARHGSKGSRCRSERASGAVGPTRRPFAKRPAAAIVTAA
jgi:hypothetical protein